jgi:DNA-directed RNA polymerase subunit M/transcription elongation factor TFIIS
MEINQDQVDSMTILRQKGKTAINIVIKKENNINIVEKWAFIVTERENKNKDSFEAEYIRNVFHIVHDLKIGKDKNEVLNSIKNKKIGWNHSCFEEIKNALHEQDEFVMNPFEITEGALQCNKCGSKRVFSYSKQTRSCDEPVSTFSQCFVCKKKWVYSG